MVEKQAKVVTKASDKVVGYDQIDKFICQKLKLCMINNHEKV